MTVVCNASPLINLARIGRLTLLREVFSEIIIAQAVGDEVVSQGGGQPGAEAVGAATWIKTRAVANIPLVNALRQELGAGEAETIVLAMERQADLVLMDERLGRETARYLGLRCAGLLGVLTECKRRGKIPMVRPVLDSLRDLAGFRIAAALYRQVLQDADEIAGDAG